jgi:hypothetical protein
VGVVAEPCYDADCYYASGETLTWWRDYGYTPPPQPVTPELPRIEPPIVEPCYDSDCYYAQGETLTWWRDYGYTPPPQPVAPELPRIDPPPRLIDEYPLAEPSLPEFPPIVYSPKPPPPTSPSPSEASGRDSGISPLPVPETGDPLYRAIGGLLSSRPAPAQATPVVVQGRPTNPWPIALVGLAAVGAVAYVMARRKA